MSLGLLLAIGTSGEALNLLSAYTAGQALTLVMLIRTIVRGMEAGGARDFSIFRSLRDFPRLVAIGLIYNVAIWIDKMIFWFMDGIGPHPWLRYHPLYDTCSFWAFLTVIPAMALNLVRLETSFYEKYRSYYGAILGEMPLKIIEQRKQKMMDDLGDATIRLLRVQGAITVAFIIFAPQIIEWLGMPPVAARVFRLACLGAFFHVLLLICILMQLYFDFRWQALTTSIVFLVLNALLAAWSVSGGVSTYGIGYAIAAFISLLLAYKLLNRSLERLHFITFTSQPIGDDDDARAAMAEMAEEMVDKAEEEGAKQPEAVEAFDEWAGIDDPALQNEDAEPPPHEPEPETPAPQPRPEQPADTDLVASPIAAATLADAQSIRTDVGFKRTPFIEPDVLRDPDITHTAAGLPVIVSDPQEEIDIEEEHAEEKPTEESPEEANPDVTHTDAGLPIVTRRADAEDEPPIEDLRPPEEDPEPPPEPDPPDPQPLPQREKEEEASDVSRTDETKTDVGP